MAVSPRSRLVLWTRAGGRCQYTACNRSLLGDLISGVDTLNKAYVAHIVAEEPGGPRGDVVRSPMLADAVENLMLMCDEHHRLIDRDAVAEHPEARLRAMKAVHEARIEALTGIVEERGSHVLLYAAKVGEHDCPVRFDLAKTALLPDRYPAETRPIQLDLSGCAFADHEDGFWSFQPANLARQFDQAVRRRIAGGDISHLSVFALAPQPLLVELGRLLSDIPAVDVFQLRREPQTWRWHEDGQPMALELAEPRDDCPVVALKLALSATVTDERIKAVVGEETSIWALTATGPHNDVLQRREDLRAFRGLLRQAFDRIKARHGERAEIHLFPALPVAAAVEVGRVWMPKSDLPLIVYDNDRARGGFLPRTCVGKMLETAR